jgi:hypothetical protein
VKCNIGNIIALIIGAIATLAAAIAAAHFWLGAVPLFIAAALVAVVSFYFIPAIKNALLACPESCKVSSLINTLGQAAAILSVVAFLVAGAMQLTALAFIASWILSWLGVAMEAAVAALTYSGIATCFIVMLILFGLLTQVLANQKCLQQPNPPQPVLQ